MRYVVIGADRDSGRELATVIDASGKADADHKAGELGWLISTVRPDANWKTLPAPSDVLDYAGPTKAAIPLPEAAPPQRPVDREIGIPDYADLIKGAAGMRTMSMICTAGGILAIGIGALAALAMAGRDGASAVGVMVVAAVGGLLLVGIGAALRILATLALAHRDIARNSFNHKG